MAGLQWSQFPVQNGRRKRARLACVACHVKKTRCDLEMRNTQGQRKCSHCATMDRECRPRPPKRETLGSLLQHGPALAPRPARVLPPLMQNVEFIPSPPPVRETRLHRLGTNKADAQQAQIFVDPSQYNNALAPPPHTGYAPVDQRQCSGASTRDIPMLESPTPSPDNIMLSVSSVSSAVPSAISSSGPARRPDDFSPQPQPPPEGVPDVPTNEAAGQAATKEKARPLCVPEGELRPLFVETYFEYCYTWCPILNASTIFQELQDSPLLDDAIATMGINLRPPMLPHEAASTFYDRACRRFYGNEESNLMPTLKAILLFYWWAPQAPSAMNRNSSWWWTSVVIRHAQQAGIHNDYSPSNPSPGSEIDRGLHRRIWWTVFSRERLTAICQGKPCMIDPDDCAIPELSLADFPESCEKKKAEVFIYWVRLCAIIGRIAKQLSRGAKKASGGSIPSFPTHLARELIEWIRSLPPYLQLPISTSSSSNYNRDVYQLHLIYLAIVVVLHITKPLQSISTPKALTPAMVAASCIARILKDVLIRSEVCYLMPITCWYSGMAFIALLQGSRTEHLRDDANADLRIITAAMKRMKDLWGTAKVYDAGFEKLRTIDRSVNLDDFPNCHMMNERSVRPMNSEESAVGNGIDWLGYFPFLTAQTSPLAEKLLNQQDVDDLHWENFGDFGAFQDLVEGFDNWGDSAVLF